MAENSKIEWTDNTFNPWMGCTKVSPACKNCYAERDMDHRYGKVAWGPNGTRVVTSDANWRKPLKWDQQFADDMKAPIAGQHGVAEWSPQPNRPRVFCASLADVFEDWQGPILNHKGQKLWVNESGSWVTDDGLPGFAYRKNPVTMNDVRTRLFALIDATPNLDWLLLTKRPENIRRMWMYFDWQTPSGVLFRMPADKPFRKNVWLGTSVENQEYAEKRIPELLNCRGLSPILWLSCEPLVGPLDLTSVMYNGYRLNTLSGQAFGTITKDVKPIGKIGWVITGGESGPGARPCDPNWFRSLRDQCSATDTPFHFKQWGEFDIDQKHVGKKNAGRLLDGVTHDGFPEVKQ